jgi:hypothetical protein
MFRGRKSVGSTETLWASGWPRGQGLRQRNLEASCQTQKPAQTSETKNANQTDSLEERILGGARSSQNSLELPAKPGTQRISGPKFFCRPARAKSNAALVPNSGSLQTDYVQMDFSRRKHKFRSFNCQELAVAWKLQSFLGS